MIKMTSLLCLLLWLLCFEVLANKAITSTKPKTNNGKKWRLGYLEGGSYKDYPPTLRNTVMSLMEIGWINTTTIPKFKNAKDSKALWLWLSSNIRSNFIEFVSDAHWNFEWELDKAKIDKLLKPVYKRLNLKDVDLMLALGTRAGKYLANNKHSTNTIVMSASDPLQAKVIQHAHDSGLDHLHALVDPDRYRLQIEFFYKVVPFKRLGISYINTDVGRSYAGLIAISQVAKEKGFKIVPCFIHDSIDDDKLDQEVLACHKKLAKKVDAYYITQLAGAHSKRLTQLLGPLMEQKVPTFSQEGGVKEGILLGLARDNFTHVTKFYANTISKILRGAKPRDLSQIYQYKKSLVINLATAAKLGITPSMELLRLAHKVYK
ncbi:MAG: ABC transporter substrate-binding protein [Bacteriovoracaceae bacterium]|nr:ABC transporter substrate-binding protein [Bacteriovoracaceae bacterium]